MSNLFCFAGYAKERSKWPGRCYAIFPFLVLAALYLYASYARLSENPQDKLLPSIAQMVEATQQMAFTPDKRSGEYLLWQDSFASLKRIFIGMGAASLVGLCLGILCGLFAFFRSLLIPFIVFISIIPPLAILPILFVAFGVDELAKVMLIFIGVAPVITREMFLAAKNFPLELLTKAMTLGANPWQVCVRIVLPQLIPRLLETVRLSLGSAWIFLIAAEAIASTDGLGYRIFLMRRYLAMDVIIPYVFWITILGFAFDFIIIRFILWRYPWFMK
ncbi:MAG: ABC transporter permease [Oligoflexia bacterium]|nr:ABC transporter permease [Oligoflexia bacterium]MBF0367277.1 ABC transporter permease [Oligoflexia bacterium]